MQAAQGIGGRVRRGNKSAFPAYVRKASRLFPNIGGAMVGKKRIIIWSNLDYAGDALNPRLKARAESRAEYGLAASISIACQKLADKTSQTKIA
ncbi:MAG: hypothetical protein QM680_06540 [Luteolibacter sp.]